MRSFTMALLGLVVALPVGIATVPAHADNDGYHNQTHRFDNGWGDHSDRYQRNDENAQRYGWNDNGDRGWRHRQYGDEWKGNHEHWRRPGEQFGYNGDQHRWDNNGFRSENHWGDHDRNDRADNWRRDND